MEIKIADEKIIFDEFFKVKKATLSHELYNGDWSPNVVRYSFEKNQAVAVIPINRSSREFFLVEQYRFPPNTGMLEAVAGGIEHKEKPEEAAYREVLEETGFTLKNLKLLHEFFVSPGIFKEYVYLYIGEIEEMETQMDLRTTQDVGEDIKLYSYPLDGISELLDSGKIKDAKTLIGLQYLSNLVTIKE